MADDIRIEGVNRLIDRLEDIADPTRYREALGQACALVEAAAKQKAPKGAGDLRRSITSEVKDDYGVVFTPLEYAPYVEFGTGLFAENGGRMDVPWNYQDDEGEWHSTSGQHPQSFLRPALEENREQIVNIIREGMKR